ncbi:MAG: hypothetical protein OEV31_09660, partial [Gammaproteobacteria bacterium]|nr:hypothetical protein [Gammaproteobacteria bacterium]
MVRSRTRHVRNKKKSAAHKSRNKRTPGGIRASLPPKLTSPRPVRLYARERLYTLLEREAHPVVWIAAPAGAGKTSLAAGFLAARKRPVLWYQVDSGDGDIASFFYHLSLLARQAAPRFRTPLPFLTPEYLANVPTFARNFFREFFRRVPKRSVLVLDNYQEAPEDSLLHEVLNVLAEELPEGLRLWVLSRTEPPTALARLRLSDRFAFIGGAPIRLTPEETAGLVLLRRGKIDAVTVEHLQQRTQGWAAGVVLMLEQGHGEISEPGGDSADPKHLFDYFASEILNRSDTATRDFLIKTALLPQIGVVAAEALTGTVQAGEILDRLTRRNYFTVRHAGTDGDTYQYHPLFREFLLERGRTIFSGDGWRALGVQAASLLAAAGRIEEAAELLRESGEEMPLAALIGQHAPALATQGRLATLEGWLRGLSPAMIETQPWLSYWLGVCRLPHSLREARAQIERAYRGFEAGPDPVGLYLAWTGIIETILYEWDDYSSVDRWMEKLKKLRERFPLEAFPMIEPRVVSDVLHILTAARSDDPELSYWVGRAESLLQKLDGSSVYVHVASALHLYHSWSGNLFRLREMAPPLIAHLVRRDIEPLAMLYGYGMMAQAFW